MSFIQTPVEKPPIGIISRAAHNRNRSCTIIKAMQKYSAQRRKIPEEWFEELLEYINVIKS